MWFVGSLRSPGSQLWPGWSGQYPPHRAVPHAPVVCGLLIIVTGGLRVRGSWPASLSMCFPSEFEQAMRVVLRICPASYAHVHGNCVAAARFAVCCMPGSIRVSCRHRCIGGVVSRGDRVAVLLRRFLRLCHVHGLCATVV